MIIHPDNQIFMLLPSSENAQNLNISIKDLLWFIVAISLILYFKTIEIYSLFNNTIDIYSLFNNTITQKGLYSYLFTFCLLKKPPSRYGMFL